MLHNTLYRLERNQKISLKWLASIFLLLSVVWFIVDNSSYTFNMEPVVVFFGGISTLFAVWWPFKPTYRTERLSGRRVADYTRENGVFKIGKDEMSFDLKFGPRDDESLYFYGEGGHKVSLLAGAGVFSEVADCSATDFSSRYVEMREGDIACVRNNGGYYALVQLLNVHSAEHGSDRNEMTFRYVINPKQGTNFS